MKAPQDTHVIVGMSGGVDSSVSAALLQQQGYQVQGLFMKNWDEDDGTEYCTAKQDLADAESVCQRLGITLHTANFAAEYWDNVFEYFLQEYRAGRTPNPDVLCNREIKFKVFLDYALTLGADYIATGHYARIHRSDEQAALLKGLDPNKDQSYFLHQVSAAEFARTLFPLGEYHKTDVRKKAKALGLATQNKKDSTGICFIGERRFNDFLNQYLPAQPGDIVSEDGTLLGQHQGLMFHTLGQRKGLGIGGMKDADETPWYVAAKDLQNNQLVVVQGSEHPALFHHEAYLGEMHWITAPQQLPLQCHCKTRYRQADQPCTLEQTENGYRVRFANRQRAVTPGQYAVFYLEDLCLGGGVIEDAR